MGKPALIASKKIVEYRVCRFEETENTEHLRTPGEGLPYEKDRGVRRIFGGLKERP